MRCKNCGSENNDSRYICEVCGSPLYDEDELAPQETEKVAVPISDNNGKGKEQKPKQKESKMDDATKKSVIIIAVLCVVLIAVIVGIIVAVAGNKNEEEDLTTTSSTTTTAPSTQNSWEYELSNNVSTTKESTTKETTTKETTTKPTTTKPTTTTKATFNVYVDFSGYGSVQGDGVYEAGQRAVLTAQADEGHVFDGWYDASGAMLSDSTRYSFTVTSDVTVVAKFLEVSVSEQ